MRAVVGLALVALLPAGCGGGSGSDAANYDRAATRQCLETHGGSIGYVGSNDTVVGQEFSLTVDRGDSAVNLDFYESGKAAQRAADMDAALGQVVTVKRNVVLYGEEQGPLSNSDLTFIERCLHP